MAIVRREGLNPIARAARGWDPFRAMFELMDLPPDAFPALMREEQLSAYAPAFDVKESGDAYVFKADLPGMREEDVDINVTGNRLTITGRREEEKTEESERFYCAERTYGSFTRAFTLPEGIKADDTEARLEDGVLTVSVPKAQEAQPKRISVRASGARGEKKIETSRAQGGEQQERAGAQGGHSQESSRAEGRKQQPSSGAGGEHPRAK